MSRPPAAEHNSWPRPASREPAPTSLATAEGTRENHAAAPTPAETAAGPSGATAATVTTAATAATVTTGATTTTAATVTTGDAVAPAEPTSEPTSEQTGRHGRKAARGRRSSVPSWDEIMFGSSRQRD